MHGCESVESIMTIFHLNSLPKSKRIQMIGEFYDTIDSLKDRNEVRAFFKDLLSADEIAGLMRRVEVAVLLSGGFTYDNIIEHLGVGKEKISSVYKKLLQDDSGYRIVVKRLISERKNRLRKMKKEEREAMSEFGLLKKKYKGRFLLNTLIDAAIEKLSEDDKALEEEAVLFNPSASRVRIANNKK